MRPCWTGHSLPPDAPLLARVEEVRRASRAHARARGDEVWDPPERCSDGTVRGWRSWLVGVSKHHGPRLVSYAGFPQQSWPRVIEAHCLRECDDLLSPRCTCGVYAFTHFDVAWAEFQKILARPRMRTGKFKDFLVPKAVGEISGWGRINLHEWGWRSEFAMVRRLWTTDLPPEHDAFLGQYYGVTVADFDDLLRAQGKDTP